MDNFKLYSSLPHHTLMGMFENPRSAPIWEAQHGFNYPTEQLLAAIEELLTANARNDNVEWGDVRTRHINSSRAGFLQHVIKLRSC